jgi:DNA-directed RNA polymerase subunit RPC12/RpoP
MQYVKSKCRECGQNIEHDPALVGAKIDCPSCGHEVWLNGAAGPKPKPLPKPPVAPKPAPVDRSAKIAAAVVLKPLGAAVVMTFAPVVLLAFGSVLCMIAESVESLGMSVCGGALCCVGFIVSLLAFAAWINVGLAMNKAAKILNH